MMHIRKYAVIICALFLLGVLMIFHYGGMLNKRRVEPAVHYQQRTADTPSTLPNSLKQQRDALSKELNELRQRLGRMDCEVTIFRNIDCLVKYQL